MNLHQIVSPLIGVLNPNQIIGIRVSIGAVTADDGTTTPGYATPGAITASIGGTFTASIPDPVNAPTTLNVSAVLTGSLQPTDVVSGTDGAGNALPAGVRILSQLSGTPGGAGTYQLSAGATLGVCTVTAASTILNVSAVASGLLLPAQTLAGAGVAAGTMITGQLSGSPGGAGLYSVTQQQTAAAVAMTTVLSVYAQVQPLSASDLRHVDMINLQGTHRAIYINGAVHGQVRVGLKGGDLVTLPNGSVWLVQQPLESFYETAGWTKALITLQDGS